MKVKAQELVDYAEQAYQEKWGYIWATSGQVWTESDQAALEKKYYSDPAKYSDYKLGAEQGKKWIGHRVSDCSGVPYGFFKKHDIKIYHGSNSIWKYNLSHKGPIVKGMKLPVGAAIFTGDANSKPHIGTLTTATCVTEAKGTIAGVVHTPISNKKWTWWGLYSDIEYDFIPGEEAPHGTPTETPPSGGSTEPEPVPQPVLDTQYATLRKGAKGELVTMMQELLMKAGEKLPKFGADGDFGSETLKAVKSFQKKHGLVVDGIVGPKTWGELIRYAG